MVVDPLGWVINAYQINQAIQLYNKTTDQIDEALTILDYVKESSKRMLDKFEIREPEVPDRSSDSPFVEKLKLLKSSIELSSDYINSQREKLKEVEKDLHEGFDKYFPKTEDFVNELAEGNSFLLEKEEKYTNAVVSAIESVADKAIGGFSESSKIVRVKGIELINDTAEMLKKSTKIVIDSTTNASKNIGGKEIPPEITNSIEENAIKEIEKFRTTAIQIINDLSNEIDTESKSLKSSLHESAEMVKKVYIDNKEEKLLLTDNIRKRINRRYSFSLDENISEHGHSIIDKGEEGTHKTIDLYNSVTKFQGKALDSIVSIAEQIRYSVPALQGWIDETKEVIEKPRWGGSRRYLPKEDKKELEESIKKLDEAQNNLMKTAEIAKSSDDLIKSAIQEKKISTINESLDLLQKKVDAMIGEENTLPATSTNEEVDNTAPLPSEEVANMTTLYNNLNEVSGSLITAVEILQKNVDPAAGNENILPISLSEEDKIFISTQIAEKLNEEEEIVPAENAVEGVTNEELGIEVRDSKRSLKGEISDLKSKIDFLIKLIGKKAMTFDDIYNMLARRMAHDHEMKTGRKIIY